MLTAVRSRLGEWRSEWRARRVGRRYVSRDLSRTTREITGRTGWVTSRAWDHVGPGSDAYLKSFDADRIPPSLHISARDSVRAGNPMPLPERCIEDFANPAETDRDRWSMDELAED